MASAVVALAEGGSRGGHCLPMSKSYHKPSRRNYTSYLQPLRDGVGGGGRSAGAKAAVGGGGGGVGDVRKPYLPSDDSFSMNRKSMSLNWSKPNGVSGSGGGGGSGHSWESLDMKRNGAPQRPVVIGAAVGTTMTIPVSQMSKAERRELRRKLRWQLEQVKLLSMKLESRERQLKGISVSAAANPTFSDAQFSVNDARPSCVGKEVTSELDHRAPSGGGGSNGFRNFSISGDDQSFRHAKKRMPQNGGGGGGGGGGVNPKPSGHGVKRASMAAIDGRDSKRPAGLSEEGMKNCFVVLRRLMTHKHGWVFNEPVDAVKLGLTDYHSVIKRPMDLGTIKGKLSRKEYTSAAEFAADVRLTFSNAMVYNPWGHDVHSMADVLCCLFEERWRAFGSRCEDAALEVSDVPKSYRQPSPPPPPPAPPIPLPTPPNQSYGRAEVSSQSQVHHHPKSKKVVVMATASTIKKPPPPALNKPKPKPKPARDMTFEEKKKLSADLQELPIDKLEHIVQIMKERNPNLSQKDDEIEVDIDTFDNETLWELHRFIGNCMKSMNQQASKAIGEKLRNPAEQVTPDGIAVERAKKGAPGDTVEEDDVDIDDDMPKESFAPVVIDKDAGYVSRSSSSGTSSSGSGSSSDSDSGSSSDSDSDAGGGDAEKRR